jgi:predicted  nucleic acid-binding Zn-ribbon protein
MTNTEISEELEKGLDRFLDRKKAEKLSQVEAIKARISQLEEDIQDIYSQIDDITIDNVRLRIEYFGTNMSTGRGSRAVEDLF